MKAGTQVVVTSCGLLTSIGGDAEGSWANLLEGRSGHRSITRFDGARYGQKSIYGLESIPDTSFSPGYPLTDAARIVLAAMGEALGDRSHAYCDSPVFVATTLGGMDHATTVYRRRLSEGPREDDRAMLKDYIPFMQSRDLQGRFGFRQMPQIVTNACSSGANAVGLAYLAVKSGRCTAAIAAGYDIVSEFVFGGFNALRLLSPGVCSPFDVNRQGLVLGEGAAVLILEDRETAERAGRPILAELRGYASSLEAYHVTKPHPDGIGAERVMRDCLAVADVRAEDVTCINAHGTATSNNDLMEAKAIARLFDGHSGVLVTANKSAVGHTLGASGTVEAVFSVLSIRDQVVPPTLHTTRPIPELGTAELVTLSPRRTAVKHVLSSSFGFGGTNAALLFSELRCG